MESKKFNDKSIIHKKNLFQTLHHHKKNLSTGKVRILVTYASSDFQFPYLYRRNAFNWSNISASRPYLDVSESKMQTDMADLTISWRIFERMNEWLRMNTINNFFAIQFPQEKDEMFRVSNHH